MHFSFFGGISSFNDTRIYPGVQIGVGIPLWSKHLTAQTNASEVNMNIANNDLLYKRKELENLTSELLLERSSIDFALNEYQAVEKQNYEALLSTALVMFENGEIDYFKYIQSVDSASNIHFRFLKNLYSKNINTIKLNYLLND